MSAVSLLFVTSVPLKSSNTPSPKYYELINIKSSIAFDLIVNKKEFIID